MAGPGDDYEPWPPLPPANGARPRALPNFAWGFLTAFLFNFVFGFVVISAAPDGNSIAAVALVICNLLILGLALAKGRRRFGYGFALGYLMTFVILIGPCFQLAQDGFQIG